LRIGESRYLLRNWTATRDPRTRHLRRGLGVARAGTLPLFRRASVKAALGDEPSRSANSTYGAAGLPPETLEADPLAIARRKRSTLIEEWECLPQGVRLVDDAVGLANESDMNFLSASGHCTKDRPQRKNLDCLRFLVDLS
jgi:hypothetical protein